MFTLISTSIGLSLPSNILAHDVINGPWVFVNDEDLLTYNKSLSNSQLFVAERALSKTLSLNTQHDFRINLEGFAEEFELDPENIKANWTVDGKLLGSGRALTLEFELPGTHEIEVEVFELVSEDVLFSDTLVFTVGKSVSLPTIQLEARSYGPDNLGNKILLPEETISTIRIVDPNPEFEYQWDLGGRGEVQTGTEVSIDPTDIIPQYILLRSINPAGETSYSDFYLLVENGEKVEIARPAVDVDAFATANPPSRFNLHTPMISLGLAAITASIIGWLVYINREKSPISG